MAARLEAAWEELTRTDDLLADILIRLPTLADVGRACAAYAAFRRVITSPAFLRRLRKLHPPSLLGLRAFTGRFQPVELPHPSVAAGRAVAGAADFRFSFLPDPGFWLVRDARGGRFVLDCDERGDGLFTTIAVCDPLFRRFVILPAIPEDLASTVLDPIFDAELTSGRRRCEIFLVPAGEDAEEAAAAGQLESFRLIWMAQCQTKLVAFVFSSATRLWRPIASPCWLDLNLAIPSVKNYPPLVKRCYASGCFYWLLRHFPYSDLVVLDLGRMVFSTVNPPAPLHKGDEFAVVELGEGRLRILVLMEQHFRAYRQKQCEGAGEWVLENEVSLPSAYKYRLLGDADGKLILQSQSVNCEPEFGCISIDFKTLELQRVRGMLRGGHSLPFLYVGYPPSLSSPTI